MGSCTAKDRYLVNPKQPIEFNPKVNNSPSATSKNISGESSSSAYGIQNKKKEKCLVFNHSPLRYCEFLFQKFKKNDGSPTEVTLGYMVTNCIIDRQEKKVNLKYINSSRMKIWVICGGTEMISDTGLTTRVISYNYADAVEVHQAASNTQEGDLITVSLPPKEFSSKESLLVVLEPLMNNEQTVFLVYRYQLIPDEKQYCLISQSLQWSSLAFKIEDVYGAEQLFKVGDENEVCSICLTEKCQSILLPCRHMCICPGCTANLEKTLTKKCPLCRKEYYAIIHYESNAG